MHGCCCLTVVGMDHLSCLIPLNPQNSDSSSGPGWPRAVWTDVVTDVLGLDEPYTPGKKQHNATPACQNLTAWRLGR